MLWSMFSDKINPWFSGYEPNPTSHNPLLLLYPQFQQTQGQEDEAQATLTVTTAPTVVSGCPAGVSPQTDTFKPVLVTVVCYISATSAKSSMLLACCSF